MAVGQKKKLVVADSDGPLSSQTQVVFDPVVQVEGAFEVDGEIHCVVVGIASGAGAVHVGHEGSFDTIDPGVVCFRDADDLAAILDAILASQIG